MSRTASRVMPRAFVSAATISALTLTAITVPHAAAQEDPVDEYVEKEVVTVDEGAPLPADETADTGVRNEGELPYFDAKVEHGAAPIGVRQAQRTENKNVTVQIMGDILGPYSQHVGFKAGDLGIMAPIGGGEFAMVFGDSFRGDTVGKGEWMSPVGVVASKDANGIINIDRPLNSGDRVQQMIDYTHRDKLTLIPSDVINIGGTLYMQAMWTEGLHNVSYSQIWKSTDKGKTWQRAGHYYSHMLDADRHGLDEMLTWEMGPDGWVYIATSSFTRSNPVYLFAAKPEDIADRSKWKMLNLNTGDWVDYGESGTSILDRDVNGKPVKAGELNLRYIDGYWVLCMFNEETLSVELRISKDIARDWNSIPPVVIAKHGDWKNDQNATNWSQPYGGYIMPGSTLNDMDIVVSQWRTDNNSRYMSTQFNVRGLERVYDLRDGEGNRIPSIEPRTHIAQKRVLPALPEPTVTVPGSSDALRTTAIVLSVLGLLGGILVVSWPMLRPLLPPQLQQVLPF